jgi:glycosyltransferase involved in cell wall biosynthesis
MISVTILTKNSQKYLKQVLDALRPLDEVLLYDNGSKDETLAIAAAFPNVKVETGPFMGFGKTHNHASSLAKNDWILSIDSDEVATPELLKEILELKLERGSVYSMPRQNQYRGKWIKWCGWHPDRQLRLYNRLDTRFTDAEVHEKIILKGLKEVRLNSSFKHFSYENLSDFLAKMQHYSELFAKERAGKVSSSPLKAYLHGRFAFFKSYILKRGFLGGYEGYIISSYNAHTAFYKYMKLYEMNKSK